jgi:hypothetical protein
VNGALKAGVLLVLVIFAGCGSITVAGAGDAGPELAESDAHLEASHDAASECPATPPLTCTGVPGACPQGWLMARRSICGRAPFPLCCPAADCEISACQSCPLCTF